MINDAPESAADDLTWGPGLLGVGFAALAVSGLVGSATGSATAAVVLAIGGLVLLVVGLVMTINGLRLLAVGVHVTNQRLAAVAARLDGLAAPDADLTGGVGVDVSR